MSAAAAMYETTCSTQHHLRSAAVNRGEMPVNRTSALGLAPERTAMHLARERLEAMGVATAAELASSFGDGDRAVVAGVVTHRQHPETARGAVFVNLEDETGHVNVVFSRGAWARWKHVARHAPVLLIRGRVRKGQGAVSFDAERVEALVVGTAVPASRDFR